MCRVVANNAGSEIAYYECIPLSHLWVRFLISFERPKSSTIHFVRVRVHIVKWQKNIYFI